MCVEQHFEQLGYKVEKTGIEHIAPFYAHLEADHEADWGNYSKEVRKNTKEQLNATIIKESSTKSESSLFTTLAVTFATTVVDKFVDSFITPSGLSALMEGERHADNPRKKEESRG